MLKSSNPRAESDHETSEIESCGPFLFRHPAVASLWRGFVLAGAPKLVERGRPALRGTGRDKSDRPVVDRTLKCFS